MIGAVETSTEHGLASVQERDELLDAIQETKSKIESRLKGRAGESDGRELKPLVRKLERAKKQLQDDKHFVAKKVRSSLDPKQRQLLHQVTEIVHSVSGAAGVQEVPRYVRPAIRKAIMEKFGASLGKKPNEEHSAR